MRILLVEDNATTRDALADLLALDGHLCEKAATPLDVVRRFADPPPDAVVLDYVLPGGDGLTLLAEMRRHSGWDRVPVVLATAADVDLPSGPTGPSGGPFASLAKPFDVSQLLAAIESAKGGA